MFFLLSKEHSDFVEVFYPIHLQNGPVLSTEIRFYSSRDLVTLEYDDTVILKFTSDHPHLNSGLEMEGEFLRDSVTVNIIDNNSECINALISVSSLSQSLLFSICYITAELELNFEACDYSVTEGSGLNTPIRVELSGQRESPFTVILRPVSIDAVEDMGLESFINVDTIASDARATSGDT